MPERMKMIIDTDPGVDDAMAIFFAARCDEIELIGLTTVFGNVTVEIATRNALRLTEMAGLSVPVAQGAGQPLVLPPFAPSANVHGAEGFGDVPAEEPQGKPVSEDAADFMARLARENPGQITICAIGPMTNIAEAMRRDPSFAGNVAQIVLMGGAVHVPGNITPHAEANTYHDPHALAEVLASDAKVTIVGLDVTMQVLCDAADFANLAKTSPGQGGFLQQASYFYLKFYEGFGVSGCGLHDPAAVIACIRPDLFEVRPTAIDVVLSGAAAGQTKPVAEGPIAHVCTGGDMSAVKALFLSAFGAGPDGA